VKTGYEGDSTQAPEQPFSLQPDLIERDTELTAVTGLIAASPGGGRLLAIEGPPGSADRLDDGGESTRSGGRYAGAGRARLRP
jgi:hypothetical protein